MRNIQLYSILLCMLILTACNRDNAEEVTFDVSIQDALNLRVGQPITFLFKGNAEFISFYSGEPGNNYAHIQRDSVGITTMKLECAIDQAYTDREYRLNEIIHAYISEDFNGEYTIENIQKAHWENISGQEEGLIKVPQTREGSSEFVSSTMDMAAFKNKAFYLAFQYNAFKRSNVPSKDNSTQSEYVVQPRVIINPLKLTKTTVEDVETIWSNPVTEWAFRVVYQNSEKQANYSVHADNGLYFQPLAGKEHTDNDVIVWMVSKKICPWETEPDRGTAIKSANAYLPSYSYTYNRPGNYTATFVVTNANLWDSQQVVKEISFTVNE